MADPWILVTNDDGKDSPALVPLARALGAIGPVRVVVPDGERSWSGKAITRVAPIRVGEFTRDGLPMTVHSGTPADGVQLGVHSLFDTPPELVVSGINLGYNHGAGYIWSSGTVGAATEGWISGIPSIAFSTGAVHEWEEWLASLHTSPERWALLADVCADILTTARTSGLLELADVTSVNIPWTADHHTPRRLTHIARTGYTRLFEASGTDTFSHAYDGGLNEYGALETTDVDAARDEVISITPMEMPRAARVPESVVAAMIDTPPPSQPGSE